MSLHADPKLLVLPEPEDFMHGDYGSAKNHDGPYPEKWECGGKRCCLLGWVALAYDDRGVIYHDPGPAAGRFLKAIVEAAGGTPRELRGESAVRVAELLFEGYSVICRNRTPILIVAGGPSPGVLVHSGRPGFTLERAAKVWRKAAEACGYDVKGAT